jgi:hypothetical protein
MDVVLTHQDAIRLHWAIREASDMPASIRFTYALGRAKRAIQPIIEAIEAAQKVAQERYLKLACDHAERDANGEPIAVTEDNRQGFRIDPARQAAFAAAVAPLNAELMDLLRATTTISLHRIPLDVVPDLTAAVVDGLWPLLEE